MNLYLPKGQEKVVTLEDCSSRLGSGKLSELGINKCKVLDTHQPGQKVIYNLSLHTRLKHTLLSLARSSHNCILPFAFYTRSKLLPCYDVSSTSNGTIFSFFLAIYQVHLWAAVVVHMPPSCMVLGMDGCLSSPSAWICHWSIVKG